MLRNKDHTKEKIVSAVGQLLAREGFGKLGINALAREAGIDKVLIYRYFGGLPGLLQTFGESTDFWPSAAEVIGEEVEVDENELGHVMGDTLINLARAIRKRPLTAEILAWEMVEQNELTNILSELREQWILNLLETYGFQSSQAQVDLPALTALMSAAVHYLVIRGRTTPVFNLIEIDTDRGWERLEKMIRTLCENSLGPVSQNKNLTI